MKLNNPQGVKGSFGIPAEHREAMEKRKAAQEAGHAEEPSAQAAESSEGWPMEEGTSAQPDNPDEAPGETEESFLGKGPREVLKKIGVEPTEKDFHDLIFRGYIEKTVDIVQNPVSKMKLTAKLKSLTNEELDFVDELLANDLDSVKATRDGLETRRGMWVMSFAIIELSGKILTKPILSDGKPDLKAMAMVRRKVLTNLSPFILREIMKVHAELVTSFDALLWEPKSAELKKS
jgi:hypothetical protein